MAATRRNGWKSVPKNVEGANWVAVGIIGVLGIWFWPFYIVSGFLLINALTSNNKNKKYRRFREYINIIGERDHISLKRLAESTGEPQSKVHATLAEMISGGYLGNRAYIDHAINYLVIAPAENVRVQNRYDEPAHAEPKAEPKAEPAKKPEPNMAEADEHTQTISQLRALNKQINDFEVSCRIDRIAEVTDDIYEFIEQNPDRAGDVRKFMNYYLPTTLKLLKTYSLLEHQSYQGENIVAARHDIENILATLVQAFEKQLDNLFAAQAVDISSDISVLETMMKKDGLDSRSMTLKL